MSSAAAAAAPAVATTVPSSAASDSDDDCLGGGSLEEFFTNKEYVLQAHRVERTSVSCWGLMNNTTDADLTGQVLWPGSNILAHFLAADLDQIRQRVPQLARLSGHRSAEQSTSRLFAHPCARVEAGVACLCANSNEERLAVSHDDQGTAHPAPVCTLCSSPAVDSSSLTSLPPYSVGCHLLHGRRVLELGSGYGMLGLFMGHFASQVTLTDYKEEVLELLERNKAHALDERATASAASKPRDELVTGEDGVARLERQRLMRAAIHVEKLIWAADADLPTPPPASVDALSSSPIATPAHDDPADLPLYDVLVGADIIYDGSIVPTLFAMLSRYLDRAPHALFLCSFISRWLVVDREVDAALQRHGLEAIRVPLDAFMPQPTQPRYQHGNMLLIFKHK